MPVRCVRAVGRVLTLRAGLLTRRTGKVHRGSSRHGRVPLARRRAERIFSIVLRQPALSVVVPEGSPPAVDRDALVAWAYGRKASTTTPRATEIFTFGPVVTADQFVKVWIWTTRAPQGNGLDC